MKVHDFMVDSSRELSRDFSWVNSVVINLWLSKS